MSRAVRLLLLAVASPALLSCAASTTLTMVWQDPSVTELRFEKLVAVAVVPDAHRREIVEDELATIARNTVPAYSVIPDDATRDKETARRFIKAGGYDAVIIVRPVNVEKETTYYSGTDPWYPSAYGSMWGYWGTAWVYAYDPGYMTTTQYVSVEALIYRMSDEKLLFAARSRSADPSSVRALTDEVAQAVREELIKRKLVPPPPKQ